MAFRKTIIAARESGLDFILFSSMKVLDVASEGREGYYTVRQPVTGVEPGTDAFPGKPLLVLVGVELATDRGNLLITGMPRGARLPLTRHSSELIEAVVQYRGLALSLRPCQTEAASDRALIPFAGDPPAGATTSEVISLAADFSGGHYYPLATSSVVSLINPDGALALLAPRTPDPTPSPALSGWNGAAAPVAGVGITRGDGIGHGGPDPRQSFRWVSTRLGLRRPLGRTPATYQDDRRAVLEALSSGRTRAVVDAWGDAGTVSFEAREDGTARASVRGLSGTWITIYHAGEVVAQGPGPVREATRGGPGPWRTAIFRRRADLGLPGDGWLLWIVSGPMEAEDSRAARS